MTTEVHGARRARPTASSPTRSSTVSVSVVIPTCRRPHLLDRCLSALAAQTLDRACYEIMVVHDGPGAETEAAVKAWTAALPDLRIHYGATPARDGPASARNLGWRLASAPIVGFTDDDCIPSPNWLAAGLAAFDRGVSAVWGPIRVPLPDVPTDWERNVAGLEQAPFATANCFYLRAALAAMDGFDERFTAAWLEDSDLHFTLLERGGRTAHAPDAVVVHPARPVQWGISVRLQRNNRFNALLYKKHPALYRGFIQAQPPWHYYATVGALGTAVAGVVAPVPWLAAGGFFLWAALTLQFCARRLSRTSHRIGHVVEMAVTSVLIPPVAVFWRLYGAVRHRVVFL